MNETQSKALDLVLDFSINKITMVELILSLHNLEREESISEDERINSLIDLRS